MEKKKILTIKKKKKEEKPKTKKENLKKRNFIWICILSAGIFFVSCCLVFALYIIIASPEFTEDKLYRKESTVFLDKEGNEFAKIGAQKRELVSYEELPQVLIDAIIATEDSRFFQHNGLDIARFAKATLGQLLHQGGAGGGSTITMQVVKNSFTSTEDEGIKGIIRKFTDIYMSVFKVEKKYTKEQIIEFYVNQQFFGNYAYGVEQACQTYFGKSVRDISLPEAALIAGMFQAPSAYNPFVYPENATERRDNVLSLMVRHGYITEEQKEIAASISVESLLTTKEQDDAVVSKYQGYIDTVVDEVIEKIGLDPYDTPMIIQTTMDRNSQDVINDLMAGKLYTFVNDVVQTGVAVTDVTDGSIAAIGAGRNAVAMGTNRAKVRRQPGSTAKPLFDYGPLMEFNNASTYTPFLDEVYTYSNGSQLKNADNSYQGLITLRKALSRSRNIPAVRAFHQLDRDKVSDFVHSLGIDYGNSLYESAAIGGFDGVSPLEASAAYAAFGRGGYYIEPYSFTKITFTESNETYEHKPQKVKVMSEETAYMITNVLMTTTSLGSAGSIRVSGTDVASKTGTSTIDEASRKLLGIPSSAAMDAWLNVYSPDFSISIWYGYDIQSKDHYITAGAGGTARTKISTAISNKILKKNSRFTKPSGVVAVDVELETFPPMLASANTPSNLVSKEYFREGTEPTDISPRFNTLANPTNGKSSIDGNKITLTWDPIATPESIDPSALRTHFDTYYQEHADKYYNNRLTYNNTYIGTLGYQVYLKNANGTLTSLTYTKDNTYTYPISGNNTSYTFVIKSAYSIFKNNMSEGLTIEVSTALEPSTPGTPTDTIAKLTVSGEEKLCYLVGSGTYEDVLRPIRAYNANNDDITDQTMVESKTYRAGVLVNNIDYSKAGNYKIVYSVNYNGRNYETNRTINVCENGCNENKECS